MTFENFYAPYLYITYFSNLEEVEDVFYIFNTVDDQRTKKSSTLSLEEHMFASTDAMVVLVREKNTGALGVLVLLQDGIEIKNSIKAHEAIHVADAYYEYGKFVSQSFDDGNEPYAYLVGWIVDCIDEFIQVTNESKEIQRRSRN